VVSRRAAFHPNRQKQTEDGAGDLSAAGTALRSAQTKNPPLCVTPLRVLLHARRRGRRGSPRARSAATATHDRRVKSQLPHQKGTRCRTQPSENWDRPGQRGPKVRRASPERQARRAQRGQRVQPVGLGRRGRRAPWARPV
jgi:hypothetical protein